MGSRPACVRVRPSCASASFPFATATDTRRPAAPQAAAAASAVVRDAAGAPPAGFELDWVGGRQADMGIYHIRPRKDVEPAFAHEAPEGGGKRPSFGGFEGFGELLDLLAAEVRLATALS